MIEEAPDFLASEYEDLLDALSSGTCIFIGAGVSELAGYKMWDELRNTLIEYFWENRSKLSLAGRNRFDFSTCGNLRVHESMIEAFDYLYCIDKALFISGMKEVFYGDEKAATNGIFEVLSKLNNSRNFFVTTNIDRGLQSYLGIEDKMVSIFPKFHGSLKLINYLHGRIDADDTWIFTRGQYNMGYNLGTKPCMTFLKRVFENYNVLFVGYGLREEEIMRAMASTKKRNFHWWLEGRSRGNKDSLEIRSTVLRVNYNIRLLPYSIENEGHDILKKVLQALYNASIQRRN